MAYPENKSKRADLLINILIGAGDGLIVPSSLLAAFTAAGSSQQQVSFLFPLIIAGAALVMGIGGYLTRKNAELQPKNFVRDEMNAAAQGKTRAFFANLGMTEEMQQQAIDEMEKDDLEWKGFINRYDLDPATQSPASSGLVIGLSYAVAGFIVLVPFLVEPLTQTALLVSTCISLPLLFVLGFLKGRLMAGSGWKAGFTLFFTGALAMAAAFFAIRFFWKH